MFRNKNNYKKEEVFRDPIHRYVYVQDELVARLIDSAEFQRLRRIKQLGTSSAIFHGAEHSRFNHSLGTYELVRRIFDEFFVKYMDIDIHERLLAICSALLHDIGHGPFSHSFEKVFGTNHEYYTQKIILESTEINSILKLISPDFPEEVASVLNRSHKNKLIIDLISSQVDTDRMDYLLRDSYYTGVSYGKFDLERLLRVIRPDHHGIVIKESGIHAVEDYIMCRYKMYRQVYFHPTSNSIEVLLIVIFQRAKNLFFEGYKFKTYPVSFIFLFKNLERIEKYLKIDDSVCLYYFNCWQEESDKILSDLCRRIVNRKQFGCVPFVKSGKNNKILKQLREIFINNNIDPNYYLIVNCLSNIAYKEQQPVLIKKDNGKKENLSVSSKIINTISGKSDVYTYLYFPRDIIYLNNKDENKVKILLEAIESGN